MTPRENFELLMTGKTPQWIPFTLDVGASEGLTSAVQGRFNAETGRTDAAEYFDFDFRTASVGKRFGGKDAARYHADAPAGTQFDEWGIGHWAGGAVDTYERMFAPLSEASSEREVTDFPEPVIEAGNVAEIVDGYHARGYPVAGYAGSIYEWSWWLRGMERFMVDLAQEPRLAGAIVEKVSAFTLKLALETARSGIDVLAFYDDAGTQKGLQISPDSWRSLIKPAWKRVLDGVRQKYPRAVFFLHSCGDITSIVPDVVELGFQILHPIQPECMNAAAIKREWGEQIVLCATLGAQKTLSLCPAEQVRLETTRLMDTLGADKRCIVCPSNRVQPETPWENVLAFVAAARNHRFGRRNAGLEPQEA